MLILTIAAGEMGFLGIRGQEALSFIFLVSYLLSEFFYVDNMSQS